MGYKTFKVGDEVSREGKDGVWIVDKARTEEPGWEVRLGGDLNTLEWEFTENLTLIEKKEDGDGEYFVIPENPIM